MLSMPHYSVVIFSFRSVLFYTNLILKAILRERYSKIKIKQRYIDKRPKIHRCRNNC